LLPTFTRQEVQDPVAVFLLLCQSLTVTHLVHVSNFSGDW
jgi:hypothetical protein